MFTFEKFTEPGKRFTSRVTIRRGTGQLGFNIGAINRFRIRDFAYASLYFDHRQRAVGIGLLTEQEAGAVEIKQSPANTYILVKRFFDRYRIVYTTSRKFTLRKDADSGLLVFSLDEAVPRCKGPFAIRDPARAAS